MWRYLLRWQASGLIRNLRLFLINVLKQKAQKEIDRGVNKLTDKIKDEKTKAVDGFVEKVSLTNLYLTCI